MDLFFVLFHFVCLFVFMNSFRRNNHEGENSTIEEKKKQKINQD